jgi:small subunit ribosomal protein S6
VFAKLENIIKSHNGILKEIEKWGIKSLAFKVSRKERGYYAVLRYYGKVDIIGEMERNIKIDNRIIRFITIKVKAEVEPDVIMVAEAEA